MATKIIRAVFGNQKSIVTVSRMQYDYGQVIDVVDVNLPATFEARFSNQPTGESVRVIGENQQVAVPDELLENAGFVWCYITVHDEVTDGRTMYTMRIPVKPASERTDAEPTPVQQDIITQAIAMVNSAVDTTSQKAQEASDSADRAEQAAEGVEGYVERAEAAQNASESARDIALEAKVSAQASAATASEKASEAISSATTASQSALNAESASESAQEYAAASAVSASASAVSASQASEHASTAGSKATEASGYASNANASAQTASQKSLEASQSAQTAVQAKTDAESAKTASQTAQTASESARDGAVTAKTDAESARDEAQEIVNGITGKVEQIDSNTDRIESLEDDRYKPYPTDIVSGSIASFPDGADDIPLKSCIVQIEPVQDLHGYENPWPAGGGKNKCMHYVDRTSTNGITYTSTLDGINVSGTATASSYSWESTHSTYETALIILPAGTYTFSTNQVPGTSQVQGYIVFMGQTESGTAISNLVLEGTTLTKTATFSEPVGIYYGIFVASGISVNMTVKLQIESGSTATSWSPYSNICPITGWTGCEVQRTGKNISPVSTIVGVVWADSLKYYPNNGKSLLDRLNSLPEGQYTISWKIIVTSVKSQFTSETATATTNRIRILHKYGRIDSGGDEITRSQALAHYQGSKAFLLIITPQMVGNFTDFYLYGLGRNIATEGAPNGVLGTADYYDIQLELGSTATDYEPYTGQTYPITFPSEEGTVYGAYVDVLNGELVVDRAQIASYNGETLPSTWISDRDVYASGTTPTIGAQVVYKLAEPIHYPLTSNQIDSLYGQNNIWANCGDTSVEYRADTKLYIEKLTQPEENDMIADSVITSGQFFMIGNSLYRALANIASGATITVGTNAQRVSLSDALNLVNA